MKNIIITHPDEDVSSLKQTIEKHLGKSVKLWRTLEEPPENNEVYLAVPRDSLVLLPGWAMQLLQEDDSTFAFFLDDRFRKSFTCKEANYGIQLI